MIIIYISMVLLGLIFGSFAGASVWRLRARQLVQDKADGEEYSKKELRQLLPLTKHTIKTDRSQCLHCHHELAWYDLLPLASWLSTGGRCRYCRKSIGWFEPAMEVGTAVLFVSFFGYWLMTMGFESYLSGILFIGWLVILVGMVVLFAYDAKWFLLPDAIMFPLIALSMVIAVVTIVTAPDQIEQLLTTLGSVGVLGGIYLLIWLISKGEWIGFGDVKLGVVLGFLLGNWQLAFLALFLANVIGLLIVLPGLLTKKMSRGSQIPFGPMLMLGFIVSLYFGHTIIARYFELATLVAHYSLML